jgi:four helix bundle protein
MSEEKGLETAPVWQKALAFALKVQREIVPAFPPEEKWARGAQLRRSVQSIPGNIAEGYGRYYDQESIHFCTIARGSLEESYTYLSVANQPGYASSNIFQTLENEVIEMRRMLNGNIAFLRKSKRGENDPGSSHMIKEDFLEYYSDINHDDPVS